MFCCISLQGLRLGHVLAVIGWTASGQLQDREMFWRSFGGVSVIRWLTMNALLLYYWAVVSMIKRCFFALLQISYQTDMTSSTSVGTTVRRFFKDTLAL